MLWDIHASLPKGCLFEMASKKDDKLVFLETHVKSGISENDRSSKEGTVKSHNDK